MPENGIKWVQGDVIYVASTGALLRFVDGGWYNAGSESWTCENELEFAWQYVGRWP